MNLTRSKYKLQSADPKEPYLLHTRFLQARNPPGLMNELVPQAGLRFPLTRGFHSFPFQLNLSTLGGYCKCGTKWR